MNFALNLSTAKMKNIFEDLFWEEKTFIYTNEITEMNNQQPILPLCENIEIRRKALYIATVIIVERKKINQGGICEIIT